MNDRVILELAAKVAERVQAALREAGYAPR